MSATDVKKRNPKLGMVKSVSSVQRNKNFNIALNELDEAIRQLGDVSHLEHDTNLVLHIMSLVENISNITITGVEKKKLVIDKICGLFPISNNDRDKEKLSKLIDFLCEQKLVTKVSNVAVMSKSLCGFLLKKVIT